MNFKPFFIIFLFITVFVGAHNNPLVSVVAARNVAQASTTASRMTNELDFDALEDQALSVNAYEGIQFAKPSRLMVLLRIVGMPLFNAYLKLSDTMNSLSTWFNQKFKNTTPKVHEAR